MCDPTDTKNMVSDSVKNDIKTLFLIINLFNAVAAGLFPLSLGVGMVVAAVNVLSAADAVAAGLPMLGLAALGCCGAIYEDKTMLYTYSALTGVLSAGEAAAAAVLVVTGDSNCYVLQFIIFHIGTTLAALAPAVFLARQARAEPQGPDSTQRTFIWRCFSFALAFLVVLVIFMKFFM